jgi:hypothetical protein
MERKISGKIDAYIIDLKDALSSKIRELGTAASAAAASESNGNANTIDNGSGSTGTTAGTTAGTTIDQLCKQLTKFVYEYEKLKLTKEDFMKRKRVKNMVPIQQRCLAKRANGEQCTRKKKEGCDYCGTHTKGVPCSIMDDEKDGDKPKLNQQSVNIWVQNIKGIEYFIDGSQNVYKHEDVINTSTNPRIIAKYSKSETGAFSIAFL